MIQTPNIIVSPTPTISAQAAETQATTAVVSPAHLSTTAWIFIAVGAAALWYFFGRS